MALLDRARMTAIAKVKKAHGMKGEMEVALLTDDPAFYADCPELYLETAKGLARHVAVGLRPQSGGWVLRLAEVTTRDGAEAVQGALVLVTPERLKPLVQGEYYLHELTGCRVTTPEGQDLGTITGHYEAGPQVLLEVEQPRPGKKPRQWLLPLRPETVAQVDTVARRVVATPPEGLLELND